MPKQNAASKAGVISNQATGAKASSIGSCSSASPSRSDMPPDKTYDMCKELCKEMSESVLRCINERFDAFEAKFQSLAASQAELQARVANQEQAADDLDARMQVLEAKCSDLAKGNAQLQTKVLDLVARSRRHNIKIVGIQEGEEEGKPTEFISRLIPKLLGEDHFPHPVKVDRAHRSLQPKPAAGAKPHTILARIHHFQEKELILRLGRQQSVEYKGGKILIFPDYTNEVMAQRRAFREVMQALRDEGIKHTMRYPAKLYVYPRDGGAPRVFADPKQAARSLERNNAQEGE